MTKKGVLIIALGDPYYGNLAANLAASIKFTSPEIPIHLVWAENSITHLKADKMALFDTIQECPHEYYHRAGGKRVYVMAKTHAYDLSPFEETLFIDADVIMCPQKTVSQLFDQVQPLEFTMENRSRVNLEENDTTAAYLWADIEDIKKEFKLSQGFLYQLHSELFYFKRSDRVASFFESVKKHFANPRVKMTHIFDGDIPDEFAFAMAMIEHDYYPHTCPWVPIYWYLLDGKFKSDLKYVHDNFTGYSVGGNATPSHVQDKYNTMARGYCQRLGVQHPYRIKPKREALASRKHM